MSLVAYRKKRVFAQTPEPSGARKVKAKSSKQLHFCVQKHLASSLHYDFRLEYHGVLLSWAVPKGPSLNPADKRLAIQVEDHPLDYGEFEGVIPSGYGAGIVMLWDTGVWKPHGDIGASLEKGHLSFEVKGKKLEGFFALTRLRTTSSSPQWLLVKKNDAFATADDILEAKSRSVKSRLNFDGILRRRIPREWLENPPVKGGNAGKLFASTIKKALAAK